MYEFKFESVNKLLEESFRNNWDRQALSNYQGVSLCYRDVARRIEKRSLPAGTNPTLARGDTSSSLLKSQ